MFVRWECGCVGFMAGTQTITLRPCDEDRDAPRDSLHWGTRRQAGAGTPLPEPEQEDLHRQIQRQFVKADRFDVLQSALTPV